MTEEKRFVVQEDANTDKIILLIDYERMKMYSFLAEEREAVNKICDLLNKQDKEIEYWKENAMTLLLQVRRLLPRMTDKEIAKYSKELEKIQDERQIQ